MTTKRSIIHNTSANSYPIPISHHKQERQYQMNAQPHNFRLDWSNLPLHSPLAKRIQNNQMTCPASPPKYWVHRIMRNGLGQMLHQWSQTLCNAMQADRRVLTRGLFVWMHESCQAEFDAKRAAFSYSPFACYFGHDHELHPSSACPALPMPTSINDTALVTNTTVNKSVKACDQLLERDNLEVPQFRAASMEWLFSHVSPLVMDEARKQLRGAFGADGMPDRDHLVTVHIRWGDKAKEMKLKPVQQYIKAVHDVVGRDKTSNNTYPLHVYIASEDINARQAFRDMAPAHWKLHSSGPHVRNRRPAIRQNANGRNGLESLGALILSMEANHYVLTTKSNWSRLINELRLNIVNPRCNNCTRMTDLIYGEW